MTTTDFLKFVPKPIEAIGFRAGDGPNVHFTFAIIQRTTALRAYNNFGKGRDWMEELATAYVVALATRSADTQLMKLIQNDLVATVSTSCGQCKDASIGLNVIRGRLFPTLKELREHANKLVHHLDDSMNKGVSELNVEGVFSYCHHLFQENADALFGFIPNPTGLFPEVKCRKCSSRTAQ
ncbi:MAG: hypothetical protein EPO42_12410 [Gallionellaceae bacterium]|nr:MAG: hypothetical protein EPO42_12410 [Gallionellaceae bacterium]